MNYKKIFKINKKKKINNYKKSFFFLSYVDCL